ncbi:MAG: DUF433 domain-containing protein, partial [Candidatus Villigracilaceae bacterium]
GIAFLELARQDFERQRVLLGSIINLNWFRRKPMFHYIVYNPKILNGKPHIAGTRLSVEFILELVASGATKAEILNAYPQLTAEAVEEALRYAAQSVKNEILLNAKVTA